MKPIRPDVMEFRSTDLILRSRAGHGVSKDARKTLRLWPSFETPAAPAPQDEVVEKFHTLSGRG
jgi:hypothetical protein